ncbi:MAG TPA: hypothetical protein VI979_01015 [archaeon]|nr:hypothetical protein [archaeon]
MPKPVMNDRVYYPPAGEKGKLYDNHRISTEPTLFKNQAFLFINSGINISIHRYGCSRFAEL